MENEDILSWVQDYFLKWSDFKASSNPSAFEDSSSNIKFHYTWTLNSTLHNEKIYFEINEIKLQTQFLRHLSWVRDGQESLELLKHEQGHFDLAEMTRSTIEETIRNKLYPKKFPTRGQNEEQQKQFAKEDSSALIAKELEKSLLGFSQIRTKYNEETNFGLNDLKQKEYDEKFKEFREQK
jgi:hypothetical protein